MAENIIAVDIGNTSISIGLFTGRRLSKTYSLKTQEIKKRAGKNIIDADMQRNLSPSKLQAVIIASVVPSLTASFVRSFKPLSETTPLVIGKDLTPPILNRYRYPEQVGQDRLVNAVAGYYLYGGPLVIVDLGTAITIDVVSKKGEYLGGIISPGIDISLQTLHQRTALLPLVELASPTSLLGRDTINSIRSGIVIGYSCLVDGLVSRLKTKYAKDARVIATGGYLYLMRRYCHSIDKTNRFLTLYGIKITYDKVKNKKTLK